MSEEAPAQDWAAVSRALKQRLDEREMTLTELAHRSGISMTMIREIVHHLSERRRHPRTLMSLSETLGWPSDHLGNVLRGGVADEAEQAAEANDDDLHAMHAELEVIRERLGNIERIAGELASLGPILTRISDRLDAIENTTPGR